MASKDEPNAPSDAAESGDMPGIATPDQTRSDGMIDDPGTLARADTSGVIENRKRTGNLTGT